VTVTTFLTSFLTALANEAGVLLLFIVIGITGWRRVWIWGAELKRLDSHLKDEQVRHMGEMGELRAERDQWRRIALISTGHPNPEKPPSSEGD